MKKGQNTSNSAEEGESFLDSALKGKKKEFDDNWQTILAINNEDGYKLLINEKQKWKMILEARLTEMILDIAQMQNLVNNDELQSKSQATAMSILTLLKQQLPTFVKLEQRIKTLTLNNN
jgi:hypothetical protein